MNPRISEQLVNGSFADLLQSMNPRWRVYAEQPCFVGNQRCPDIVVTSYGRQPVVIENEWRPARRGEAEARSRLGEVLDSTAIEHAGAVRSSIALRTPRLGLDQCNTPAEVAGALRKPETHLEYALLAGRSADGCSRFPASGFISGTLADLAVFVDHAGVSTDALRDATDVLERGVAELVGRLRGAASRSEDWKAQIAAALRQDYDESKLDQMLGIAATVLVNAMVFQEGLAGNRGVRSLAQMQDARDLSQDGVLAEWDRILQINYWSIFRLARELLAGVTPPKDANDALRAAAVTAAALVELGVARSHDLAGIVFQRFIGDRKYLASFYTRPESAALLAHLAVPEGEWGSAERMTTFRAADYACGTGTLIHAAYHRLNQLHELAGGDPARLHKTMIEEALTACDIVPSAAHLTAAMLSSVHPNVLYDKARVLIAEYGERRDRSTAVGSLDLLSDSAALPSLFPMSAPEAVAAKSGRTGEFAVETRPESQDLVIMNPPFTRAMSDWEAGAEGSWKQYRGLGTSKQVQKKMDDRMKELGRRTFCYHGSAGIASAFVAVADKMCRAGGTVAFVLPLTAISGMSWARARALFTVDYQDVTVISLAGPRPIDQSWSADTKMAEALIVARKRAPGGRRGGRGAFVTLRRRPANAMEATEVARAIRRVLSGPQRLRRVEDGPVGGTVLAVGGEVVGGAVGAPLGPNPWWCCPVLDAMVVQTGWQLAQGSLWLPTAAPEQAPSVPVRPVGEFAIVGWADNNIANNRSAPFDRRPISGEPAYPMLWRNRSAVQRKMVVEADVHGLVREGRDAKARDIWAARSWVHHTRDFSFTSQSLGAAFTVGRTIGGRGWPNVQLPSQAHEKAYCLWGNTTLGLVQYWCHASKQQIGRGLMPVTAIDRMPFLDVTSLAPKQLDVAEAVFAEMKHRELRPAYLAERDAVRKELDARVLRDVLGLDWEALEGPLEVLRRKWCAEPSVRAGKPVAG